MSNEMESLASGRATHEPSPDGLGLPVGIPDALGGQSLLPKPGCELCADPDDGSSWYPMYGVAPHECYWRKGPQFTLGQSTLLPIEPEHCFVPELEEWEDWSHFRYPAATGVYYCPNCQADRYQREWDKLTARIGPPPAQGMEARQGGDEGSVHDSPVHAPETGLENSRVTD